MKAHLAKVSLAVLSTVLLLGCQDMGSEPVGPEGPQFHGGAGECSGHHKNDQDCDGGGGGGGGGLGPQIAVCCTSRDIRSATKQITAELMGTYSTLTTSRFNETSPPDLALKYDVLIFLWKSSPSVNADWTTRLLPYMQRGGGIIFEAPRNVGDLAPGVSTKEVQKHTTESSTEIDIDPVPGLTTVPNFFSSTATSTATFINNHIIFDVFPNSDVALMPFLTLTTGTKTWPNGAGEVVGLYGVFGPGRIVLTGLDNDFHGRRLVDGGSVAQQNHYNLLFNEICWVINDENLSGC